MERLSAVAESRMFGTRRVPLLRPLGWLARGAQDLRRCPVPGLLHGLAAALFGALVLLVAHDRFWLLSGAFSGFLIVAPVLATGLYQISRALDRQRVPRLADALAVWMPTDGRLMVFGLLLAFAGTGWVLTSASLITGFSPVPIRNPQDFLRYVVLAEESMLFEAWLALGGNSRAMRPERNTRTRSEMRWTSARSVVITSTAVPRAFSTSRIAAMAWVRCRSLCVGRRRAMAWACASAASTPPPGNT